MLISFAKDADLFTQANEAHRRGQLAEAEALYRQLLTRNPNHSDALHMLGPLAHQAGNQAAAVALIERSLPLPTMPAPACSNLAEIKRTMGKLDEAEMYARKAISIDPNMS